LPKVWWLPFLEHSVAKPRRNLATGNIIVAMATLTSRQGYSKA